MKIGITGGCGFIGTNLVQEIAERSGWTFTLFDNFSTGSITHLEPWEDRIVRGDVKDKAAVLRHLKDFDAVVHLAAHTNVIESVENPERSIHENVLGTFHVLEACRINRIPKCVIASSNAAAGEQDPPIREDMLPAPLSAYGMSKLSGEMLCHVYRAGYGVRATALRFSNVYGPLSEHKTSVVAKFIRRVLAGKDLIIYGDGRQTRDFIAVGDIVQAVLKTVETDPPSAVYQIGTGVETTVLELVDLLLKTAKGCHPQVRHEPARTGEILRNFTDYSLARKELGFKPRITLEAGLKATWEYLTTLSPGP